MGLRPGLPVKPFFMPDFKILAFLTHTAFFIKLEKYVFFLES